MFGAPMLMLIDPRFIPGPLLCAALVLSLLLAHRERLASCPEEHVLALVTDLQIEVRRDGVVIVRGPVADGPRVQVERQRQRAPIEELGDVIEMVRHHHEHFDGKGYPAGISGADIPLGARVLAVADAYDALTSERPYRGAVPEEEALLIFEEASGTQFDPVIASAFLSCKRECVNGYPESAPAFGTSPLHDAKSAAAPAREA